MLNLDNATLQFSCQPESSAWSLSGAAQTGLRIENVRMRVRYRLRGKPCQLLQAGVPWQAASPPEKIVTLHGPAYQARVQCGPDANHVLAEITFVMPEAQPFFLWKVRLKNQGKKPITVDKIEMLRSGTFGETQVGKLQVGSGKKPLAFFSNGWQSWCYTGAYIHGEAPVRTRLPFIQDPVCNNPGTPAFKEPGHYTSDFYGVLADRKNRVGLLAGFLSQKEQFGSLEAYTHPEAGLALWANGDEMRLDPGAEMTTDWAVVVALKLGALDPQAPYLDAVAREYGLDPTLEHEIPIGWCSWYEFYQKVTAAQVQANLDTLARLRSELPLGIVQIDDGFERQPGDWFAFRRSFPKGVEPLAREIFERGLTPGLWLAPYIVHPDSRLIFRHPEMILRNKYGTPVNAGFIWDRFTTALDLTHPGARDYACGVVDKATHEWGFAYLKLDFLYAGAVDGARYDPTVTRAQALRRGLESLRRAAGPGTYLLGCGAPLGSSIGLFDAMRIGADTSGFWAPRYKNQEKLFHEEPNMPSARNALQNTLSRAPLHGRWWVNDPDCLLLRPTTQLTQPEMQSIATAIALTGGSLMLSDNLATLPSDRRHIAQLLLPVIGKRPWVIDWIDATTPSKLRVDLDGPAGAWHLLAQFNWAEEPADLKFRFDEYQLSALSAFTAHSFWTQENYSQTLEGFHVSNVPPHGVAMLALRPVKFGEPGYVGSNLHITQGFEIGGWEAGYGKIHLQLSLPRKAEGQVVLSIPRPPTAATIDGRPIRQVEGGFPSQGCYRFNVAFDHRAVLEVSY